MFKSTFSSSQLTFHYSTATFQLTYTQLHTHLFFDQVYNNIVSGFTPNSSNADPNWGKCLQCAAFDRGRSRAVPSIPRSSICSQCFKQYCFDPTNPPSLAELPNRKLAFVDPDPQGLTKVELFFDDNKFKLLGGFIGLVTFIALLAIGL